MSAVSRTIATLTTPERQTYHLNFYSKDENCSEFPEFPRLEHEKNREYSAEIINDLIARANKAGFLAQYNHPHWSTQTVKDFGELEGLWGFEVYNGTHEKLRNGWGHIHFTEMLWEGKYTCPTGGDDNHAKNFDDPRCACFSSFTMIKAPKLEYNAVLSAMEKGDLYASTGPLIEELYVEDGKVHIKTSPTERIILRTQYRGGKVEAAFGDTLTEAVFDLEDFKTAPRYIRFEIWDSHNKMAMTRAFFPEEWK